MSKLSAPQRQEFLAELPGLKRFCLSLTGNGADADDLLQSTVERVLERGLPDDAHLARWSFRVCKNLWIDEVRSREVRTRHAVSVVQAGASAEAAPSVCFLDRRRIQGHGAEGSASAEPHLGSKVDPQNLV